MPQWKSLPTHSFFRPSWGPRGPEARGEGGEVQGWSHLHYESGIHSEWVADNDPPGSRGPWTHPASRPFSCEREGVLSAAFIFWERSRSHFISVIMDTFKIVFASLKHYYNSGGNSNDSTLNKHIAKTYKHRLNILRLSPPEMLSGLRITWGFTLWGALITGSGFSFCSYSMPYLMK